MKEKITQLINLAEGLINVGKSGYPTEELYEFNKKEFNRLLKEVRELLWS